MSLKFVCLQKFLEFNCSNHATITKGMMLDSIGYINQLQ
jgi:hypothetical protein